MVAGYDKDMRAVLRMLPSRAAAHNLTLVSAGVAFYGFLAFVPTLIIVVAVYGRIAEPRDIERQVHDFARALPDDVERFIQSQITAISKAGATGVSVTLVVALVLALWSASGGMAALITGIRVALDLTAPEGFVKKRGKALLFTVGAVGLLTVVVFLVAALPPLLSDLGLATEGSLAFQVLRWPALLFLMATSLGVVYRLVGDTPRSGWLGVVTPGSAVGALVWLVASGVFAAYTANFARYSRTYGTLASIVVVLLWLYLSALAVLLGAEFDGARSDLRQAGAERDLASAAQSSTSASTG
jgi:membrane protein